MLGIIRDIAKFANHLFSMAAFGGCGGNVGDHLGYCKVRKPSLFHGSDIRLGDRADALLGML